MPQDSVEEFKVSTTGQTADFNNSSGSQSQVVTKRGHDKWHGTVYEYYLDNNIGANTWQNNFPTAYTPKPSYHFNRFGAAAGGPIAPDFWGGKTYLFANYEGFRYPAAATYERAVPSYEFLQLGQLTFGANYLLRRSVEGCRSPGIGMDSDTRELLQDATAAGAGRAITDRQAASWAPSIKSCGALSGSVCDSVNVIGYKANVLTPQKQQLPCHPRGP